MKKLSLILILASYCFSNAQIVNIPDLNFKNALLNHEPIIDINNDGEIQFSEAENTLELYLENKNISDLAGIESFINLTILSCPNNQLNNLDVNNNIYLIELNCSNNFLNILEINNHKNLIKLNCNSNSLSTLEVINNLNLTYLRCHSNLLNILNVSNNTNLIELNCSFNSLNTLDVSNNIYLNRLFCSYNSLTSLDVSNNIDLIWLYCNSNLLNILNINNNTNLTKLYCGYNSLTTLDLSSNSDFNLLHCYDNNDLAYINLKNGNNNNFILSGAFPSIFENLPNLQTVCVDELNTDLTNFILTETGHDVEFTINCPTANTLENTLLNFTIYPIPVADVINIKSKTNIAKIEIFSNLGQLLLSYNHQNSIDISNLSQGLYFVKITDVNGDFGIQKVIKN